MISQAYLNRLAQIESGGNALARNPKSSAAGRYQFISSTAQQYGITAKPGTPEYIQQEDEAIKRFTLDNALALEKQLGRKPTDAELYLAHQQGAGGATKLLANPEARAVDILGKDAVLNNGGSEDMTAQEFADLWVGKFQSGQGDDTLNGGAGSDTLTPDEQDELAALEDDPDLQDAPTSGLTPDEEAELAALENDPELVQPVKEAKEKTKKKDYFEAKGIEGNDAGAGNAFAYGVSAGQIPFGNRITSAIGAVGAKAYDTVSGQGVLKGKSVGDLYEQSLADTKATQEAHPWATAAGNATGILTTLPLASSKVLFGTKATTGARGVLNAIPEGIAAASNFARSGKAAKDAGILTKAGSFALRSAKGAVVAAPAMALYGAGEADPGKMLEGAGRGAGMALAVGPAGAAIDDIAGALSKKTVLPTFDEVRQASRDLYKKARSLGAEMTTEATDELINRAIKEIPTDSFAKNVIGDDEVAKLVERLSAQRGQRMTLESFEQLDKSLGDLAHRNFLNAPDISRRYGNLQTALRDIVADDKFVSGTKEGLKAYKEAQKLWSISSKMNDVQRIIDDAAYFDVPATAIKTGFRRLARNDKLLRGYTEAEKKAIRAAAKTGRVEGIFKTFGSRLLSLGAGITNGPLGAVIGHATSGASRAAAESIKGADAAKVSRMLAQRSGMAKEVSRFKSLPAATEMLITGAQRQGILSGGNK